MQLPSAGLFPVLWGRSVELLPLVVGYAGRKLGTLPLKGLAFVRRRWHVGDDSAGGKDRPLSRLPSEEVEHSEEDRKEQE